MSSHDVEACPICGSKDRYNDTQRGDVICTGCGLVIDEYVVSTKKDWRAFTREERNKRERTGMPASDTMHDKGMSTVIEIDKKDVQGLSAKRRAQIYRLRRWQIRNRAHTSIERNISRAMVELTRICSQMNLAKNICEYGAKLYKKAIGTRLIKSRSIDALAAASIFAACRLMKFPRTLEEIAEHSRMSTKKIGQHYRLLVSRLKLKMPISTPEQYLSRMINEIAPPSGIQNRTTTLINMVRDVPSLMAGKDPRGIAAACLYIVMVKSGIRITQKRIAELSEVTEVTVRNRYKEICSELDINMSEVVPLDKKMF